MNEAAFPCAELEGPGLGRSPFMGTARSWTEQKRRTVELMMEAIHLVLARGAWWDGTPLSELQREAMTGWVPRLDVCGTDVTMRQCEGAGHVHVKSYCCRVPCCPVHQKRSVGEWLQRAVELYRHLPDGASLAVKRKGKGKSSREQFGWRMVTVSIRPRETFDETVDYLLRLRSDLFRFLGGRHGMPLAQELEEGPSLTDVMTAKNVHRKRTAAGLPAGEAPEYQIRRLITTMTGKARIHGFGCLELSETGFLHLHCLVYSSWIQVEDRDRYPEKRQGGKHLHGLRSWLMKRTGGDWYVDVRRVYDKTKGRGSRPDNAARALQEAIKYAAAPVGAKVKPNGGKDRALVDGKWRTLFDPAQIGSESTPEQLHGAERVLRLYAVLYRRHRVQAYGLATKRLEGQVDPEVAEGVTNSERDPHSCPRAGCGSPMHVVLHGTKQRRLASYDWSHRWRHSRAGPAPGPVTTVGFSDYAQSARMGH